MRCRCLVCLLVDDVACRMNKSEFLAIIYDDTNTQARQDIFFSSFFFFSVWVNYVCIGCGPNRNSFEQVPSISLEKSSSHSQAFLWSFYFTFISRHTVKIENIETNECHSQEMNEKNNQTAICRWRFHTVFLAEIK